MRGRPAFRGAPVRVRVPATSANLGPGFDALGLALGLYDDVVVAVTDGGLSVEVAGEGAGEGPGSVPLGGRHLVVKALRAGFGALGGQPPGLHVVCANRIPHSRGLGASAAAIVAGLVAAGSLAVRGYADGQALRLATRLEGHPDNVAACLYGGLTLAYQYGETTRAAPLPITPALRPVVLVPATRSSTKRARALLPDVVRHVDAARQAGRAALLVEALGRRPDLLLAATEDLLHQRYRAAAMPGTASLIAGLRGEGVPAVVSGAGPTVLALCRDDAEADAAVGFARRGWTAHRLPVAGPAAVLPVG